MKKIILCVMALVSLEMSATAQTLKVPAPSPSQTLKQDFGLSTIEVSYSRPSVKDRTIFGDVVPFGAIWRTGANNATTITFGDTVSIGGVKVHPGKYGLLTIPGASEWILIISKSTSTTSADAYKQEEDVVRVKARPVSMAEKMETFSINIGNIRPTSCELQLCWDKTMVSMPISTDIDARIMKDIERYVIKDNRPYGAAANYYMENGKDLKLALDWYDKAIASNPRAYWNIHQKANCYAKLGMKKEATETATRSMAIAKEEGDDTYVRLNEKLISSLK
ncbi:MAG: DUF2911 domain-containing protein [Bacteroidia bacterium]|nr:DUF2911 domain-containing protein [Bacteroidia bacterium]